MKHVKMFGKSVPLTAIVLVSILTIGVSALLVDYLSNPISTEALVESPIVLDDDLFKLSTHSAGTTQYVLVKGVSNADHPIPVKFDLYCSKANVAFDGTGIDVDLTTDIQYFFEPTGGYLVDSTWTWLEWLTNNDKEPEPNGIDWEGTIAWEKGGGAGHLYFVQETVYDNMYTVLKFTLDPALDPGIYTFTVIARPVKVP